MTEKKLTRRQVLKVAGATALGGLAVSAIGGIPRIALAQEKAAIVPKVDGVIEKGEYAHTLHNKATGMDLHWSIVEDRIYFGLHSPGKGWLSLGLSPKEGKDTDMEDAELTMGYVKDGKTYLEVDFAPTPDAHQAVKSVKGDIISFAGSKDAQGTTLEFERLLVTKGEHTKPIVKGVMTALLAYADKDDFTTYHDPQHRNKFQVNFFAPGEGS